MNDQFKKFLMDTGFSEKESLIYLTLLTVEKASVIKIAELTKINRTTIYPILDELKDKKMIIEINEGKKVFFQAEPPERIETYIHTKKLQLEEQEKVLTDMIPRMRSISLSDGEKPIIKIYEGREAIIKSAIEFTSNSGADKESYTIYPRDTIQQLFSDNELKRIRSIRTKKGIHVNSLYSSKENYPSDETSLRHQLDPNINKILCEINVFGDTVRIHTFTKHLSAIFIKSSDFAETMKTLFKLAIDNQKKPQ